MVAVITAADSAHGRRPRPGPSRCSRPTGYASSASRWRWCLTDDRYQGEDAAELVSVEYEPLTAVPGAGAR